MSRRMFAVLRIIVWFRTSISDTLTRCAKDLQRDVLKTLLYYEGGYQHHTFVPSPSYPPLEFVYETL